MQIKNIIFTLAATAATMVYAQGSQPTRTFDTCLELYSNLVHQGTPMGAIAGMMESANCSRCISGGILGCGPKYIQGAALKTSNGAEGMACYDGVMVFCKAQGITFPSVN